MIKNKGYCLNKRLLINKFYLLIVFLIKQYPIKKNIILKLHFNLA